MGESKRKKKELSDSVYNDKINDDPSSDNLPVIRKAAEFSFDIPENPNLNKKENRKIQNAVKNEAIAVGYETYISDKGVKDLLNTDSRGAAVVINRAPRGEVKTYGSRDYLSTPEAQKEIARRKEQARPQLEKEYLDTSSKALDAFSQNQQLEKERCIKSDRNNKERPKIGKKVINERKPKVSEITGAKLDDTKDGKPVVHHVERAVDNPERFTDDKNLVIMRNDEHLEFHTDPNLLPTEEGLDSYRKRKK